MTRVNLLVGGPVSEWAPELAHPETIDGQWVTADRGTWRLLQKNIIPVVAVGDFDSLSTSEREIVQSMVKDIRSVQAEKDDTDTQLALTIALTELQADQVVIYGATGGRVDHFLANLFIPLEERFKPFLARLEMRDRQNTIRFYGPGDYQLQKEDDKTYLAFVPLVPTTGLNLIDERYRLVNYQTQVPISWASNEFIGSTGRFSFKTGIVAVIQSKD
ncbi:thiamine diphosphokinase [Latilactobacillus graminis]|uniref:Thiamine diphosphokinase n=2 Tax=Latilactobacillus graminis TaxID=60519 RepID=A0AA89L125_9LACO|nr:thiamine diphosphokinase [Latilactobacillus graminis]KRM23979.1 thiamine pyrophosphokinase [Latilactobacillus graminis DSM 20719]QFP79857.1 thiamine diphosphokinase [Latilactobacillus graminis]